MTVTPPPLAAVPDPPATLDPASIEIARALLNPAPIDVDDDHPVDFGPDGTVTFTAVGRDWTLRAPTLGEFRTLVTAAEKLRTRGPRKADEGVGDLATRTEWWRTVMATLGDEVPPKMDDLPMWTGNPRLEFAVTAHWMRLPTKAPGSDARPGANPTPEAQ